ncbi:MAG: hypothetical protein ABIQ27_10905 [Flavobacterium sp.]|uniref:hypothetical protein n=1 Tax=Flavobacterium sp. TaxID=239 RepID=UPI003267E887
MQKLSLFFIKIRELTFWNRLFAWRSIRSLSYEAFEEFRMLEKQSKESRENSNFLERELQNSKTKNEGLQNQIQQHEKIETKKDAEVNSLNDRISKLNFDLTELNKSISKYETSEEDRKRNYEKSIIQLNQLKETLENEIKRVNDDRVQEQKDSFEKMKNQWSEHETIVEQALKMICQNHLVKYVDNVPFRGSPDNTIEICDEYIIFDAKCPSNEDLTHFPKYIKAQTESVKKYANQEKVKKDIFLVVPTNTIQAITQLSFNMGDYNVYVITKDALEPIILSLKKIEDYEFMNQLSPEERDNICRVIGKFAHITKRKIQIDQFFATEFLEILGRCKNDLPDEILKQVIEYEKAERLNPPNEKKAKQILTKELQDKHTSINVEASIRDVSIPSNFEDIKNL